MTTAHDLALIALGLPPERSVEQGDLSLALAGAEAVDLLDSGALTLDGDRMVPAAPVASGDPLLDQADAALLRREPYETVDAWLWRRGDGLAAAYVADLRRAGPLTRPSGHRFRLRSAASAWADSPARRAAEERKAAGEPVLTALLAAAGMGEEPSSDLAGSSLGDAVTTVVAAVGDAVARREALRLRHDVEHAAFDNVWRA